MANSWQPAEPPIPELDYTTRAQESFYDTVDDPLFQSQDIELIYQSLTEKLQIVKFGDFLKRYIYMKAGLSGKLSEIPTAEFQEIICAEFSDRQTPCSFSPTTARLKNLCKNWLEQQSVQRSVVLLLGFGLGMNETDVNLFLTKALQEPRLNAKDPLEVICWYCYHLGLSYPKFEQLWDRYHSASRPAAPPADMLDSTLSYSQRMHGISGEEELMDYLSALPIASGSFRQSVDARKQFDSLYSRVRDRIAQLMTAAEMDEAQKNASRLREALSSSDRIYDYQKQQRIDRVREDYRQYSGADIGPGHIEHVIYAAVPTDARGNLLPMKKSALNRQFAGKRMNRQHLGEILSGEAPVSRFDLITLNFFLLSQEEHGSIYSRYAAFQDTSNRILSSCGMGPLYIANPYECFLLMCVLSEDPLGTYADVWEQSYADALDP